MINQTAKRAPQKAGVGVKLMIMGASVAATLGGWGVLAFTQAQEALANAQPQQPAQQSQPVTQSQPTTQQRQPAAQSQPSQPTNQNTTMTTTQNNPRQNPTVNNNSTTTTRQVSPSFTAPRAQARTRSSR